MALKKIYRPKEVDRLFGWSPSTRKRKIQEGEFRKPLQLGPQMVGWEEEYLVEYRNLLLQQNLEDQQASEE